MAKRTNNRSQPADSAADQVKTPAPKRATRRAAAPAEETPAVAQVTDSRPTTPEELPDIPEPGDAADRALRSESMSSSPSDEDIRLRAYHRYLQRGGGPSGDHFNDWIEAEQELRGKK